MLRVRTLYGITRRFIKKFTNSNWSLQPLELEV
jgi:hypothetical protein